MNDTTEHIAFSIEKWKGIKYQVQNRSTLNYFLKFWTACGYCKTFDPYYSFEGESICSGCPLHRPSRKFAIPYCDSRSSAKSVASQALRLADQRRFEEALIYIDILLNKMRRDLKHERDGG